ncbi:hypothetical protein EDD11_007516 [Mortierella claussenii]|nr:hypothetical protein EDD11_007516 [Mortierella claussenii]
MWSSLEKLSLSPAALSNSSQSTKMAVVAVAASVTTAAVLLGYQGTQRKQRVKQLKRDLELSKPSSSSAEVTMDMEPLDHIDVKSVNVNVAGASVPVATQHHDQQRPYGEEDKMEVDEELVSEQLARNIAFLGEEGVQKLRDSFVVIVGAGGVGSWAASMLIKSGVGRVRIIDFAQVSLSGLNQHATASRADIGSPKATTMKKYFRTIAPWVKVDARVERFQEDSAAHLLSGNPDYVVDAIGDLSTKLQLLKYCCDHKIPVMSSMDAGAKADPSRVQISDISDTFEDPLSRVVRRRMKRLGVDSGIEVVFSIEKPYEVIPRSTSPSTSTSPSSSSLDNDKGYRALPNFPSSCPLPVFGPLPAMFGMSMATFITCKIAGWEMDPFTVKFRMEIYQRLHRDLIAQEEAHFGSTSGNKIALTRYDIGYIVEEIFRGKSAISQSMDKIAVCRWRREEELGLLNTVVLTEREMERHLALPKDVDLEAVYGKEVVEYVESRYREEEAISRL